MRRRRKKEEIITPCPLKGGSFPLLLLARARKRNKKARSLQGNARKNRKCPDAGQVRRREAASGRMIVNGVLQVSIMEDTKGGGVDKQVYICERLHRSLKTHRKGMEHMTQEEEKKTIQDDGGGTAKGHSKNPRGRVPLSPAFRAYAAQAPERLRAIADDPETPVKIKVEIERWFAEMWFGKSPQAQGLDDEARPSGTKVVRFEGVLDDWSR